MFSDDIRALYQEMILDHGRSPRYFYELESPDNTMEGFNPVCGDQVKIFVKDVDGVIKSSFAGSGCAISMAATSLLLEAAQGRDKAYVLQLIEYYREMLTNDLEPLEEKLGKLVVLAGVRSYPSRIKCATLGCHALKLAIENDNSIVATTE
jgi:nitrogen fixation NifU-like protein